MRFIYTSQKTLLNASGKKIRCERQRAVKEGFIEYFTSSVSEKGI